LDRQKKFEDAVKTILELIGEDTQREGLLKTPQRVFKAYEKLTEGYKKNPTEILKSALFDTKNQEMIVVKDIEFYSLCEHHLLPIIGRAHIAYIPKGKVVGLSKLPRVIEVFARRLQIQEEMTESIAESIMSTLEPLGVGVVIEARHMCMEMRGVEKVSSSTTTSSLKGIFLEQKSREEFFNIINSRRELRF
jgi:GTP cyclohydrolase I